MRRRQFIKLLGGAAAAWPLAARAQQSSNKIPVVGVLWHAGSAEEEEVAEEVSSGHLMSYGRDIPDFFRRAAGYVDKILKGAKPADLPVEQPTKFKLVLNLKTANTLGIGFPQSLILSADEMIGA